MKNKSKYRAFISYSHADQKWGRWLHKNLESYRPPKRLKSPESGEALHLLPLTPIFRDQEELASSPDLSERINSALSNSEALIVICSPSAARSPWVDREISAFKEMGHSDRIYCLIVAGDPGDPGTDNDCFPPSLRIRFDERGKRIDGQAEPIAADARDAAGGKKLALLKLLAGLHGVGLDDLRQRDLQRRNQRLAVAAVISMVTTLIMITLSITAVFSRNEAVMARNDAEQRREQAEGLISFMLGDLRDRLQPVGRLDVLDGVGEQALAYFSSLPERELSSDTLLTRATALRQIGEVRVAQGLISEGLVAFNESRELLENASTENEGKRLFELGQINYWIADAYLNDLQLDQAQVYILKYLEISRDLARLEPSNQAYQLELLYAEINLGTLAYRANDMVAAQAYFTNALTTGRQISKDFPGNEIDFAMPAVYSWLGAVDAATGRFDSSLNWYEQHLQLRRELYATTNTPANKHRIGRALFRLADIQAQVGMSSASVSSLNEAVQIYRELIDYDPQNYDWQREYAWSLTMLARESSESGEVSWTEARALLSLANDALERINEEDNAENSRVSASIEIELGRIELLENNVNAAVRHTQLARQKLVTFIDEEDRTRIVPLYGRASYFAAEAMLMSGDAAGSKAMAESALTDIAVGESDPLEVRAYAALLAFLAQAPSAENLLASVRLTEYVAAICIPGTEADRWWSQRID